MEKRSRRRTRDLVTQAASQGLSENEIGCARISMMARSTNAPRKGRIQMSKTNPLPFTQIRLATHGRSIQLGQTEKSGRATGRSALPPTPDMALQRITDAMCHEETSPPNHIHGLAAAFC